MFYNREEGESVYAYAFGVALDIVLLLFFFIAVYYFILGVFSFFPEKERYGENKTVSFAVLIPAHNEARVLPDLLDSIRKTEYPREKIGIFVIADRCMDQTAELAARFGAEAVVKTGGPDGKGAALRYGCAVLKEKLAGYNYITVLDADNLLDADYFLELARMHNSGHPVVQGYVDVKNPYTSWIALAHAMWYWVPNRMQRMGRRNLGLSVSLQGTGFSIAAAQFLAVVQTETGVAEDAEYTLALALEGDSVAYAKRAVVYDEKPDTFRASVRQRVRWVQGLWQAQKKYRRGFIKNGMLSRIFALWGDGCSTFVFCLFFIVWFGTFFVRAGVWEARFLQLWSYPLNFVCLNLYIFGTFFMIFLGLWMDKKLDFKILLNIFGYLLYILSWIPVFFIGILRQSKNNWYHTEHHGRCGENWRI